MVADGKTFMLYRLDCLWPNPHSSECVCAFTFTFAMIFAIINLCHDLWAKALNRLAFGTFPVIIYIIIKNETI
jgi:hypothetical protein